MAAARRWWLPTRLRRAALRADLQRARPLRRITRSLPEQRFAGDLGFLGNRLPDREERVEAVLPAPAAPLPDKAFLIGGAGWEDKAMTPNVRRLGHVYTREHNAFNRPQLAVLNIARDSMAAIGFSPATRVFEAAGAGACLITDAWEGIEHFLKPDDEVLVARDGQDVVEHLAALTPERAHAIGRPPARASSASTPMRAAARQVDAILREESRPHAREERRMTAAARLLNIVVLGPEPVLVLGQRPRDHLSGAADAPSPSAATP